MSRVRVWLGARYRRAMAAKRDIQMMLTGSILILGSFLVDVVTQLVQ